MQRLFDLQYAQLTPMPLHVINENINSVVYKDYNLLSTINKQLWNWVVPKIMSQTIQYALNYNVTAQRGCYNHYGVFLMQYRLRYDDNNFRPLLLIKIYAICDSGLNYDG